MSRERRGDPGSQVLRLVPATALVAVFLLTLVACRGAAHGSKSRSLDLEWWQVLLGIGAVYFFFWLIASIREGELVNPFDGNRRW